jgi:hypothetical protein
MAFQSFGPRKRYKYPIFATQQLQQSSSPVSNTLQTAYFTIAMFPASKLIAALSILTLALASPILEARSCTPNFQGNPLTIYKTIKGDVFEWTPVNAVGGHITLVHTSASQAFANGEFLVEFTGQPDNAYHLKFVAMSSSTFTH